VEGLVCRVSTTALTPVVPVSLIPVILHERVGFSFRLSSSGEMSPCDSLVHYCKVWCCKALRAACDEDLHTKQHLSLVLEIFRGNHHNAVV
jgi:hypothetical protein